MSSARRGIEWAARTACALFVAQTASGAAAEDWPAPIEHGAMIQTGSSCLPEYPPAAAKAAAEGTTGLEFTVDETGRRVRTVLQHASGATAAHRLLDDAAIAALQRCPFSAATDAQGHPITATLRVSQVWSLRPPMQAHPAKVDVNDPACAPLYPPAALRAQAQGTTYLEFMVDGTGKIMSSRIVKSSGSESEHGLLDQAALSALANCPVEPGTDPEGHAIATLVRVGYRWKLD